MKEWVSVILPIVVFDTTDSLHRGRPQICCFPSVGRCCDSSLKLSAFFTFHFSLLIADYFNRRHGLIRMEQR